MFAWKAFQFRLFDRHPAPNVYSMEPQHFRLYKPGEAVEWDDTPKIEKRAAKFYRENLLVAGDRVFCRVEYPCLYTRSRSYRPDYTRILTPFGGFGDPLIEFETAYAVARDIASTGRGYRGQATVSYDTTSGEVPGDGLERFVRACFGDLFGSHPWYGRGRECLLTPADRKSLPALHKLWRDNFDNMTPTVLDTAVEMMMPFARKSGFERRLQDWLDRPIDSPVDLFG